MTVVCHVEFAVNAGAEDRFVAAAREVMRISRQEDGCVVYNYGKDLDAPQRYHITEVWESKAAMDIHFACDHAQKATAEILSIARITGRVWEGDLHQLDIAMPE